MAHLTDKLIKSLKPRSTPYDTSDDQLPKGAGVLMVNVTKKGTRIFRYQQRVEGKRRFVPIGKYPDVTLTEAREQAREYGLLAKQNVDVKAHLKELAIVAEQDKRKAKIAAELKAKRATVHQLFNGYTDKMKLDGKRTFQSVYDDLIKNWQSVYSLDLPAEEIEPGNITEVLAKMIDRGAITHSNRVRAYLHAAWAFGLKADNDPMNRNQGVVYNLKFNPVSAVARQGQAEKVRERCLTDEELAAFLNALDIGKGFSFVTQMALKMVIFTGGQRAYEIVTLRWSDIDFNERLVIVGAEYSKLKKPHHIPINDAVMVLLEQLKEKTGGQEWLFPNHKKDGFQSTQSLSRALSRWQDLAGIERFQNRDLRRTIKTLMVKLKITPEYRNRLQNHALGNDVAEKHYNKFDYYDEKLMALDAIATYINTVLEPQEKVVMLTHK